MEQFRSVLKKAKNRFLSKPNVVGVGVGYKETGDQKTEEMSVVVYVTKKENHRSLDKDAIIPRSIDEMPTDVVEIGEIKLLNTERRGKLRPAQPGCSLGHIDITAGTFGALVRDNDTGELLILSNNHVLANSTNGNDGRAAVGDNILQPGRYDGGTPEDVLGVLHRYIPIYAELTTPECATAKLAERVQNFILHTVRPNYQVQFLKSDSRGNLVDCAVAKPLSPRFVTNEILDIGPIKGIGSMRPGMQVQKSGRTTGHTTGAVKTVSTSLRVQMGDNIYAVFNEQAVCDLKSAGGDSGSLVLDDDNHAVGLLFAGSDKYTIVNQIHYVLDNLAVSLVTEREDEQWALNLLRG